VTAAPVLHGRNYRRPVYGLLGQQWRTRRSWFSALLVGGAVLLEPTTRVLNLEYGPPLAYLAELGAGVLAVAYFLATLSRPSRMSLAPPAP
jgi:hypothetical protein